LLKKKILAFLDKKLHGDVFFDFRYYQNNYYIVSFVYYENNQKKVDYFYATDDPKEKELLNLSVNRILTSNHDCTFICFDLKHAIKPLVSKHRLSNLLNVKFVDIQLLTWLSRTTKYDGVNINDIYNYTKSDLFSNSKIDKFYKIYQRKDFEFFIPIDIFREYFLKEASFLYDYYLNNLKVSNSRILQSESLQNYQKFLIVLSLTELSQIWFRKDKLMQYTKDVMVHKDFEKLINHRSISRGSYYYNNVTLCHSDYGRLGASKSLCNFFTLNKKYRDVFFPAFDTFMSVDLKANHTFYLFKKLGLLDNVKIDSNFDIYSYIDNESTLTRAEKKIHINAILFGGKRNEEYTKQFFVKFPKIKQFFANQAEQYKKNNYIISDVTNKYNTFNTDETNWMGTLISFILQNETAYEMFNFVTKIQIEMAKKNMISNVWFIMHDEIIFDVKNEEIEIIKRIINGIIDVPHQISLNNAWNFKD